MPGVTVQLAVYDGFSFSSGKLDQTFDTFDNIPPRIMTLDHMAYESLHSK